MQQRQAIILVITVLLFTLALGIAAAKQFQNYMLLSSVLVLLAVAPFFLRFERRQMHAREVVLIAMLAAIAAVSRVPFAHLPSVQPTTFVIVVTALVFGAESGFMVGAIAVLVSNLFLGQGPWTPWQMLAWGFAGLAAGALRAPLLRHRWLLLAFGVSWGFLFGWIMNIHSLLTMMGRFSWQELIALSAASLWFDIAHALSNLFFLAIFASGWLKVLRRFKKKYSILEQ